MSADYLGSKLLQEYPYVYSYEPQRKANGYLYFPGVELKTLSIPFSLVLALKRFDLPKTGNNIISTPWMNGSGGKFIGKHETQPLVVTFNDMVDTPIMAILEAWRAHAYNPDNGAINYAAGGDPIKPMGTIGGYRMDGFLILLPPDGDPDAARVWLLDGCIPAELDRGEIDPEMDEPNEITLTLVMSKVKFLFHGVIPVGLGIYRSPMAAGTEEETRSSLWDGKIELLEKLSLPESG